MSSLSIGNLRLPRWFRENKRLRNAALVAVALLCVDLLLYAVLIAPSVAWLRDWEGQYADLRKRRTEAVLFEKQKKELSGIRSGIMTQKDMPLLVKDLVQAARRSNLAVSSVKYDIPKGSGDDLAMLSFLFPAEGRYADLKRFIYEVETSDRLVGIQDLKFEEEKGVVRVQMKLITYVKGL
jgi:Tfp pilus assembly protein PilO